MSEQQSIQLRPEQREILRKEDAEPSIGQMMAVVISKGVTSENVAALEKLCGLYERMESKKAEKDFNAAFVQLQSECSKVKAVKAVPNNDGTPRYKFAPFEEIMDQTKPLLMKHGFTVSFSQKFADGRIIEVCTLRHTSGHSVANEFAVRIGKGPPGASETQSDGAAATYAKRFALCDALAIVIDKDNDATVLGATISKAEAAQLRQRVRATGSDEAAFLRFAQSPISDNATDADVVRAYEAIPSSMVSALDANLRRKESTR